MGEGKGEYVRLLGLFFDTTAILSKECKCKNHPIRICEREGW